MRFGYSLWVTAVLCAASCAALPACSLEPLPEPPDPAPTAAEHGAQAFEDPGLSAYSFNTLSCDTCHEKTPGDGGDRIRPGAPLAGVVDRTLFWGDNEVELLRAVNQCLRYFMLQDEPWTGQEPEARDIYAFLASLPATEVDRANVPFTVAIALPDPAVGSSMKGADVYRRACQTCHGEAHTGAGALVTYAGVLPDDALAAHPLGEYTEQERRLVFVEKVRHGGFLGYAGQMPPFSKEKISDADLGDLLAFFGF